MATNKTTVSVYADDELLAALNEFKDSGNHKSLNVAIVSILRERLFGESALQSKVSSNLDIEDMVNNAVASAIAPLMRRVDAWESESIDERMLALIDEHKQTLRSKFVHTMSEFGRVFNSAIGLLRIEVDGIKKILLDIKDNGDFQSLNQVFDERMTDIALMRNQCIDRIDSEISQIVISDDSLPIKKAPPDKDLEVSADVQSISTKLKSKYTRDQLEGMKSLEVRKIHRTIPAKERLLNSSTASKGGMIDEILKAKTIAP
jgi:hypothetical protein